MHLPDTITDLIKDLPEDHPALNARSHNELKAQLARGLSSFLEDKRRSVKELPPRSFKRVQTNLSLLMISHDILRRSLSTGSLDDEKKVKTAASLRDIHRVLGAYTELHDLIYSGKVDGRDVARFTDDFDKIAAEAASVAISSIETVLINSDLRAEQAADMIMRMLADQSQGG